MPIYEFQCAACGNRIEELMRLSDPDPVECPKCGAPQLKRALSAPSFRLSGSGWYETDFKKDGKRNLAGDAGESKSPESKSDSSAASAKSDAPAAPSAAPASPAAASPASGGAASS